jgi:group I intron endonuclease
MTGIYKILNRISGNFYIGSSSTCIKQRWASHKSALKHKKHHSPALQNAYNKYGISYFDFIVIELCSPDDCIFREQAYLDLLNPEYNCCKIAGSTKGVRASEYQKAKAREIHKGNKYNLGKKHTKESVDKRNATRKLMGYPGPMTGRNHSEVTKLKLSQQRKGIPAAHKGKHMKKPIYCFNNNKTYQSTKEAIHGILKEYNIVLHGSNISNVLHNIRPHVKGFKFCFVDKKT